MAQMAATVLFGNAREDCLYMGVKLARTFWQRQ